MTKKFRPTQIYNSSHKGRHCKFRGQCFDNKSAAEDASHSIIQEYKPRTKSMKIYKIDQGGSGKKGTKKELQRIQVRETQTKKEQFRNMITHFLQKYKINPTKAVDFIINGFKSNRTSMNTLVPVSPSTYLPINKQNYDSISIIFVPALSIIISHIQENDALRIIDEFIQNTGNINLTSIRQNISALSVAIDKDSSIIASHLLKNGADFDILSTAQLAKLNALDISESLHPLDIDSSIPKNSIGNQNIEYLQLPSTLPLTGYDLDKEPDFWKPIFEKGQMEGLKIMIQQMIADDMEAHQISVNPEKKWSICEINKTIIPTYNFRTSNELYEVDSMWYKDKSNDFAAYNTILCASFLVLGIISYQMRGQPYKLIFKGGKAIQIELSGIPDIGVYDSEDIDILILPNENVEYDEDKIKNLAGHVAHLVRWFVESDNNGKVSILSPENALGKRERNDKIYKLSYQKSTEKYTKYGKVPDYRAFSDIDFRETPEENKKMFNQTVNYEFYIPELHTQVLFTCNNIGSLLNEKIYYYVKYFEFKDKLLQKEKIGETKYECLTVANCEFFMTKFKRAILALNHGLQIKRYGKTINNREKEALLNRIQKYVENKEEMVKIADSIYFDK